MEDDTRSQEFGLIGWLNETRVKLPLKGIECQFDVCGDLVAVEIDQIFHQNNSKPMDCLYSFPLPADAAVHRCEMHVNGRVIKARVEEQEAARKLVAEKKAEGHRTALVETERDNLFTLNLGNLQPSDVVVIRFAYFQKVTRLEDWTSFKIPSCPGERYIPGKPLLRAPSGRGVMADTDQVPDASRISPPRIDQLHPDAAYLHVQGRLDNTDNIIRELSSPSHPIVVTNIDECFEVGLGNGETMPDRDLALRWTEVIPSQIAPSARVHQHDGEQYAMVRLRAPEAQSTSQKESGQDVYFLIDRSGSMAGDKWEKTAKAFNEFVRVLGAEDRVWATLFETSFQDFAEKPLPAREIQSDQSAKKLVNLGTGGGTELLPALLHVLKKVKDHSSDRTATLVVITDGQVGNESGVIKSLQTVPNLRTHTFGIDTCVNDGFLRKIATQQRGTSYMVTPEEDIVGTISRLATRLRPPVLTSLDAEGKEWQLAGNRSLDLRAGEVATISLKGSMTAGEIHLTGRLPNGDAQVYQIQPEPSSNSALRFCWAKERIDHLLATRKKPEAIELAKLHNLVCEGAAFMAWDESEKVNLGEVNVYQPATRSGLAYPVRHGICARYPMPIHDIVKCGLSEYTKIPIQPDSVIQEFFSSWHRTLLKRALIWNDDPALSTFAGLYSVLSESDTFGAPRVTALLEIVAQLALLTGPLDYLLLPNLCQIIRDAQLNLSKKEEGLDCEFESLQLELKTILKEVTDTLLSGETVVETDLEKHRQRAFALLEKYSKLSLVI